MLRKLSWFSILIGGLLLVFGIFWMQTPQVVDAQCGNPSSCKTCHEIQGQAPVNTNGVWHTDHEPYDACVVCHGGNRDAKDVATAHIGVVNNLTEMTASCQNCHTDNLAQSCNTYAAALGVTIDVNAIPAQKPSNPLGPAIGPVFGPPPAGPAGPAGPASDASAPSAPVTPPETRPQNASGNLILGFLLAAGVVGGSGYVIWNEKRLRRSAVQQQSWLGWVSSRVRQEFWSPYAAGVLLGLVAIGMVVLSQHLLSASGGFATLTSTIMQKVAPAAANNTYFKFITPPGFNWQVMLLVGIFFGGFLASLSSGTFRLRWNDDPVWMKVFGPARWKRFAVGFLGAVLLQYGAGIAGGCTSGLAISGGMLLAPAAFIFMGGMFASGILVAILVYRRRY